MKVLIGCEFTGITREAFKAKGHDAWSSDFLDSEIPGQHYKGDVRDILQEGFDLAIFHPPCQFLSRAGLWAMGDKWEHKFPQRKEQQATAVKLFLQLATAPIPRICIENPHGIMRKIYKIPTQVIQPYYFGSQHQKTTCLWLKNLPRLNGKIEVAADIAGHKPQPRYIAKSGAKLYFVGSQKGGKYRSKSFSEIALAMAEQWNFVE